MAETKKDAPDTTEAEGWRPTAGDSLTGTVTEVAKGWSDYTNSYYPIVTIQEDDTNRLISVHCFHEILRQRMMDARPVIGSPLTVKCIGEKETRDGKRKYVAYQVTVPGDTGERVWDDLGAQAGTTNPAQEEIPF